MSTHDLKIVTLPAQCWLRYAAITHLIIFPIKNIIKHRNQDFFFFFLNDICKNCDALAQEHFSSSQECSWDNQSKPKSIQPNPSKCYQKIIKQPICIWLQIQPSNTFPQTWRKGKWLNKISMLIGPLPPLHHNYNQS